MCGYLLTYLRVSDYVPVRVLVGCLLVYWICWAFCGLVPWGCKNTGKTGALSVIVNLFCCVRFFASIWKNNSK